jgi:hypothetical protein
MRIHEMGTSGPAALGQAIHLPGKATKASGMGTGERSGAIVRAMDQHGTQELAAGIALTSPDPDLCRLYRRILSGDADRGVERILFGYNQGCHELLSAGHLTRFIGILLVERPAGSGVDENRRDGMNRRGIRGPD